MASRWVSFAVWFAVAGSVLLWGQRLSDGPQSLRPVATSKLPAASLTGDLTRLLGADLAPQPVEPTAAPATTSSLQLVGVIATQVTIDREAVALIQVDDKPARAFRLGQVVDKGAVLLEVNPRGASVGPRGGPAAVFLALDVPPSAVSVVPDAPEAVRTSLPLVRPIQRSPTMRQAASANGDSDVAPNVLLNNPSEMDPANAAGAVQARQP